MHTVLTSLARAVLSQLHLRMLLLTILPFILSVALWAVILWIGLQPAIDWLHALFIQYGGFQVAGEVFGWLGLDALRTVVVPLIAMWVLLPLMILTALLFVGTMAMPVVVRHVARRHYPHLEEKHGGSLAGTLWISSYSFLAFAFLWILTLPLAAIPPLTFIAQPLLWGWLTYRVMAYDALAEHASPQEYRELIQRHRGPLLLIGSAAGVMGAAPTLLWLGGALSVILFPILAAGAIWLYVLIFVFSGLWFTHYSLAALGEHRTRHQALAVSPTATAPAMKDIN